MNTLLSKINFNQFDIISLQTICGLISHRTTKKITLGTAIIFAGSTGLIKSGSGNIFNYFPKREIKQINYLLAGVSTLAIGTGIFLIYSGIKEIYQTESLPLMNENPHSTALVAINPVPPDPNQMCELISDDVCETNPDICKNNLNIKRADMPQIQDEVSQNFLNYFQEQGIEVFHTKTSPTELYATQNEINWKIVIDLIKNALAGHSNPCDREILTSHYDNHVIDGHHRLAACRLMGKNITVAAINTPTEHILRIASDFPGITQQSFHSFLPIK